MPFNRPIPKSKQRPEPSSNLAAIVQAEKLIQIALVLPCAAFIGWVAGAWLDTRLHQSWLSMAGIVVGIVSGLVGAVRMAIVLASKPRPGDSQEGKGKNA
jgi:uncharacterized membrane protein YfcA